MVTRRSVLTLAMAGALAGAPVAAAKDKPVLVDSHKLGPRIPSHFMGFSGEFHLLRPMIAQKNTGVANPVMIQLAQNLAADGDGAPVLRVGGGSTDSFWFANGKNQRGPRDLYTIDYNWLKDVKAYVDASHSPLIIGVNLGRNDPALAAQWAQVVMNWFTPGSVKALEIGNEPDNYFQRLADPKTGEMTRPPDYGPADYLNDLSSYTSAMLQVTPTPPIAGPATIASYADWLEAFPEIIAAQRKQLSLITIHRYPLLSCGKTAGSHRFVNPLELMGPHAVDQHFRDVRTFVLDAARYGKRVRITESNSVACGGADHVSNAFASSIWGVDWLFLMAAAGTEGVDFHTASSLYQPFTMYQTSTGRRAATVRPLYYAMLLFAEATAHHARLITSSYPLATTVGLHTWSTYDRVDHAVRVAVVNKTGKARRVPLRIPLAHATATIRRLTGPSLGATDGIKLGGRSFANPTFDGQLPGPPHLEHVRRRRHSVFSVKMPRFGVALLTVHVSR
jgi:hypothetical protein